MSFFKTIGNGLKRIFSVPLRVVPAGDLLGNVGLTIVDGIIGTAMSIIHIIFGVMRAGWDITVMIFRYINCIIAFFTNLPYCFFAHLITGCVLIVYYLIVLIIIIIRYFSGIDLQPSFDMLYEVCESTDDILRGTTGVSFMRFPPSIVNRCYKCGGKILSTRDIYDDLSVFTVIGNRLSYVFNVKVPDNMQYAKEDMEAVRDNFYQVIAPV
jgi:hypothetical protein